MFSLSAWVPSVGPRIRGGPASLNKRGMQRNRNSPSSLILIMIVVIIIFRGSVGSEGPYSLMESRGYGYREEGGGEGQFRREQTQQQGGGWGDLSRGPNLRGERERVNQRYIEYVKKEREIDRFKEVEVRRGQGVPEPRAHICV